MALSDIMMFDGTAPLKAFEMGHKSGLERLAQQNKVKIGQVMSQGDYKAGAKAAYGFGDLETGSGLARLAMQQDEMAAQQQAAEQKAAREAQIGEMMAGVVGPELGGLARLNPNLAGTLYSAQQNNEFRTAQANKPNLPQGWQVNPETQKAEPVPGFDPNAGKKDNAPAGYRFTGDGNLEPIKGGPADPTVKNQKNSKLSPMPAELAARIGLAKDFDRQYKGGLREKVQNGIFGEPELSGENITRRRDMYFRRGPAGEVLREIKGGSEALTRMLTGAGMNLAEAENEVKQYLPEITDTTETILSKMDMMQRRLDSMVTEASAGRVSSGVQDVQEQSQYQGADGITEQDIGGLGDQAEQGNQYPQEAIELLASDPSPEAMQEFDDEFGKGAARRVLGQ